MPPSGNAVRFAWWNPQSFAHYEPARAAEQHWPLHPDAYTEKCRRVDVAMAQLFADDPPEILAFAEVTKRAIGELRDRRFPGYAVLSLDLFPSKPELQVAILYKNATRSFREVLPIAVPYVPRGT